VGARGAGEGMGRTVRAGIMKLRFSFIINNYLGRALLL